MAYSAKGLLFGVDDYSLVEQYFHNRDINDFSYTKKDGSKKKDDNTAVESIIATINKQREDIQQEIDMDFSAIYNLSNDKGTDNLLNEAKDQGVDVPVTILTKSTAQDLSFWFFNNHKAVFNQSDAVQPFLSSGWKRVPVPNKNVDIVSKKKDALEKALRSFYAPEGCGQYCLVDIYPKKDRVYVVAYVSARGINDVVPDEATKKLKKTARRDAIKIYFLYLQNTDDEDGGELEIKAKGGYPRQRDLLGVFSKSVLDHELDDTKQKYDLEILKNKNFSLIYDAEDEVEGWWLKALDLRTSNMQTHIKVSIRDENKIGVETMWDQLRQLQLDIRFGGMLINNAEMKIKFKPTKKHPRGTKTFSVSWKDSSTLNDIDDLDIKVGQILKKSKIDRGFSN